MQYSLEINEQNQQAHIDIEKDIEKQKNGLFTFILRINNGRIVDYNVVEYANANKYLVLKKVTISQFTITPNIGVGNQPDPLRTDNSERKT